MQTEIQRLITAYQKTEDLEERQKHGAEIANIILPPLKAYLLKQCPEFFDDVFQDTVYAFYLALPRFRNDHPKSVWPFLYRIADNKLNDELRRRQKHAPLLQLEPAEMWAILETAAAPEEISAGDRMDYEYLLDLIRVSKPDCADLLKRRYALGQDYSLLAKAYKVEVPTARMRTERCLERARGLAKKHQ